MTKYYPEENIEKLKEPILTKWCYGCNKIKPLTVTYWSYTDKTHSKFRNKCRKCTNWDSMISHRIHRLRNNIMEGLADEGIDTIYKKG